MAKRFVSHELPGAWEWEQTEQRLIVVSTAPDRRQCHESRLPRPRNHDSDAAARASVIHCEFFTCFDSHGRPRVLGRTVFASPSAGQALTVSRRGRASALTLAKRLHGRASRPTQQ